MKNICSQLKGRHKGYLYVLVSAVLWGTLPIFSTFSYRFGSDALTSATMRSYLSCGIFLVWMLCDKSLKTVRLKELPFYVLYGMIAGGGTFLCYMMAIEHLSTAMAAILLYTGPAFVIIFDRIFYGETITRTKLIAVLCTFLGCLLVLKVYNIGFLVGNILWVVVGILSGICYSMTTVMGKKAKEYHSGKFNAGMMCIFGPLVFLFVKPPGTIQIPDPKLWICFIGLAVLGTVLAYAIYLKGLDLIPDGGTASIIATLEPIVGAVFGVLFLGDRLEILQIIGIIIVVVGICLPIINDR